MKKEKALQWYFDNKYNGKFVICYYITHQFFDNVFSFSEDLDEIIHTMDTLDLWADYYIYEIIDNYAYPVEFL